MRQLLRNRQIMLLDHPRDKRTTEIMGHDLDPYLITTLARDVVNRMLGDAFPGDMAASTDAVKQEAVVLLTFLELLATKRQPGLKFGKRPVRRVLDQFLVALADHAQTALVKVDLRQVQVDRLRLAHARAI